MSHLQRLTLALTLSTIPLTAQTISTVAGNGTGGFSGDGGPAISATMGFNGPLNISTLVINLDNSGNLLIADGANNRIRKVDASGNITTLAGGGTSSADGVPATTEQIFPDSVMVDSAGNIYVVAATSIKKIAPSGVITTIANVNTTKYAGDGVPALNGGTGFFANSAAIDGSGNIYMADSPNNRIRKIDAKGIITTYGGNGTQGYSGDGGPATSAMIGLPLGICVDAHGNVYFAEAINQRVRKIDTNGIITTLAGDGLSNGAGENVPATSIAISPTWVYADNSGNVFVADSGSQSIRKISPAGTITTVAGGNGTGFSGDGGPATKAQLNMPTSVAVDASGNIYFSDAFNFRIRKVTVPPGAPAIASVVNGASFAPGIAANSWGTVTGTNLSPVTDTWANSIVNGNLPSNLDGVTVTIAGALAYIYYVSPTQINFIAPPGISGSVQVIVTTPVGSATATAAAAAYAPAFFTYGSNQVIATYQNYTLASPAKPGDVLILWGAGFGPTAPATPSGVTVPSTATYSTTAPPTVTINNVSATVYGAALAPGFAGLYQIAIQVPLTLANGSWPLVASIGGIQSAATTLIVHN